ncbi:VOC family protein [Planomonospora sp. ID82291]|uniref:VOC family protein n=1 Tax=Planomonospora sp. ID82291 TaxID=2738136 RepID=UPI001A2C9E0E|nr:VOC family protein [Planomonospora sp. ID82291]MBG0817909.1 VOC family protein [Planomonospora sp. ID82291]
MLFINLPVKDLAASRRFFTALGFVFDDRFADEKMEAMAVGADTFVTLLTEDYFATYTDKKIADTGSVAEAIFALGVESRRRVDDLVETALANGGSASGETKDLGFVYTRGFADPDGHLWEATHMDFSAAQ